MTPRENDVVHAGAAKRLAIYQPYDGVHMWRAVVRFEPYERSAGAREQTLTAFAHVSTEGADIQSGIVRVPGAISSEDPAQPARLWITAFGHAVHVMAATTGPSLRCHLLALGSPAKPDASWLAEWAQLMEAQQRRARNIWLDALAAERRTLQ